MIKPEARYALFDQDMESKMDQLEGELRPTLAFSFGRMYGI